MERSGSRLQHARRALTATLLGILLYTGTSWLTYFASTGSSVIAGNLRPGVAVPIFFGFVFGPVVGFLVGFCGNLLNDILTGTVSFARYGTLLGLVAGLLLNWQVGNGLMGLVAGLVGNPFRRYRTRVALWWSLLVSLLAVIVGIGCAAFLDPFVFPATYADPATMWHQVIWESFIPITLTNAISAGMLVPILLFNQSHLDLELSGFFRSGLISRLLVTIVISAAVPTVLLSLFLLEANVGTAGDWGAAFSGVFVNLILTILLTMVFIVTNAAIMARSITRPLINLSRAAQAMEKNTLTIDQAIELKTMPGDDEVAQLSRIFGTMSQQVILREQELRKHVQELQIVIDEQKRVDQVKEIVETDFFRDLKDRARQMRDRGKAQPEQTNEQPV